MLSEPDFVEKKIILVFPKNGDKISFKNDNLVITDAYEKIKMQISCYKIFSIFIIGEEKNQTRLCSLIPYINFYYCRS